MTPLTPAVAVAVGPDAVETLEAQLGPRDAAGQTTSAVRHRDLGVLWDVRSPWVQADDDGEVLVVLDGRLHNLDAGSATPGEALRRRYRHNDIEVAAGLLGDFVMVILDRASRLLLVARDPLGVRPWYQAVAGPRSAGASDVATLAALDWVDTSIDESTAVEYLAAMSESRGGTFHRGIRSLRPGHTWYQRDGVTRTFAHHRWNVQPELDISWDGAAERSRAVFDEVVASRLRPQEPATSELSGGLDSSAVVGTLVCLGAPDLVVGRLLFDGARADERLHSDAVIDRWRLPAVSAAPWTPSDDESRALVRQLRRPLPDPHFTMFAGLHRALLDQGRTDGMTGLGGDDAFVTSSTGSRVVSAVRLRQRTALVDLAHTVGRHPHRVWTGLLRPTLHHLAPWRGDRLPGWVTSRAAARADLPRLFRRRAERVTGIDAIDERLANITSGYDAEVLETRAVVADWVGRRDTHPFLDPRFVEATYGLDPSWPTRDGHFRALQVAAFADRLPETVAARRDKADFSEIFWPPLLRDRALSSVRTGPLVEQGWLDQEGFDALTRNAQEGKANAAIPLSRCVELDRWLRAE